MGFWEGASSTLPQGYGLGAKMYEDLQNEKKLAAQQAEAKQRQGMLDQRYDSEQLNKDYQFEREMGLKERELKMKPGGGALPPGVKLSPDQVYDPTSGVAKAIPGSKLYQAEAGRYGKDAGSLSSVKQKVGGSVSAIDDFMQTPGALQSQFGGGYTGQLTKHFSPDAKAKLGNITAGIRSAGLDMMRQGGSVGTMTEREWPMVEQLMANITNSISEDEAKFQFEKVKAKLQSIQNEAERLHQLEWANTPYSQPMQTSPKDFKPSAAPGNQIPMGGVQKKYQIISVE